jgi:hypothetical protein
MLIFPSFSWEIHSPKIASGPEFANELVGKTRMLKNSKKVIFMDGFFLDVQI